MRTTRPSQRPVLFALLCAPLVISCSSADSTTRPTPTRGAAPAADLVALSGSRSPRARPELDVGRLDPETPLEGMSLLFRRSPEQKGRSEELLRELQDPTSPRFRRWLRPADVAATLGAAPADQRRAIDWLRAQGFTVHGASPTATRVVFSGTAAQVERAFSTELHRYVVDGEPHFALAREPSVPADLARVVLGLHGVHDFRLRPASRRPRRGPDAVFDAGSDGGVAAEMLTLAPADFATIYDVTPLYAAGITGTGQKIGVMGQGNFKSSDVEAFRATYGLDTSLEPSRDLVPLSGSGTPVDPSVEGEPALDLEWSGAIAKDASISYVYTGDNHAYSVFDAFTWAVEEDVYQVLTSSYGECELAFSPSEDVYVETIGDAAAMEGITVVSAAGDYGAGVCGPSAGLSVVWPSSVPSIVAVGGTMMSWGDPFPEPPLTPSIIEAAPFDTYWDCTLHKTPGCSPTGYVPETAWNEVDYEEATYGFTWGAGGGGPSSLFSKPYWQVGQTPTSTQRLLPDVSLTAAAAQVGYMFLVDGHLFPTGGTSASTPSFAGVLALLNQAVAAKDPSLPAGLGNINPMLYALNASTRSSATPAFHDVTTGNTDWPCKKGSPDCSKKAPHVLGYAAGPGYDMATGIGSIDAQRLVDAWTGLSPTSVKVSVAPAGTTEGSSVALTATVASTATSTPLTGSVVFYFDTLEEGGLSDLSGNVTGALTATFKHGKEGGTATASVVAPAGLLGQARVVAFYGGDAHYLASWSTASSVTETSTLSVSPSSVTLNPNAQHTFKAEGGVPPIQWRIVRDGACKRYRCSEIEPVSARAGDFLAGPEDGVTQIAAIDADGAEATVTVTISGAAVDGGVLPPPWDAGATDGGH